eukprot:CAMPEP_0174928772 /NCGR_PEP_ID=MMETSP1355-20121228/25930_1 /TAXON_ID=464990 /ORGANISM="Hemiselmis tepida, Strain CCMP443" /LENGTH=64 /DNA_ID=CAMNT_0016174949 /DNA_START=152 /DNA_END=343 /DNA_ORIENTATION=-
MLYSPLYVPASVTGAPIMPGEEAAPPSESERCVAQLRGHPSNPSQTLTLYMGAFEASLIRGIIL